MLRHGFVPLCLLLACSRLHAKQTFEPIKLGTVIFPGSIRNRIESWDWFTAPNTDHAYTYDGSTLRFSLSQSLPRFDWDSELEAPVLLNLPSNSVAAGT